MARVKNRREQILTEASHLFAHGGYNGTSIRHIAKNCQITEAAIYRHFASKVDLYEELIRTRAAKHDIKGHLARHDSNCSIEQLLTDLAEYVLELGERDAELMQLMLSNSRENDPAAAVLFREIRLPLIDHLRREISRRISAGEVRDVDPAITARCFVGMVVDCALSVGVWELINRQITRSQDVIRNNVPIFARGLRVQADPVAGSDQNTR